MLVIIQIIVLLWLLFIFKKATVPFCIFLFSFTAVLAIFNILYLCSYAIGIAILIGYWYFLEHKDDETEY